MRSVVRAIVLSWTIRNLFLLANSIGYSSRVDFSLDGKWVPPNQMPNSPSNNSAAAAIYCDQYFMCTPPASLRSFGLSESRSRIFYSLISYLSISVCSPLTWATNSPMPLHNNISACDALVKKGIKKILFSGDSYMRQIYAATLITLKGDYKHGSIDPNNQQAVNMSNL